MSERRNQLSQMLDTTLQNFTKVLTESKNFAKLARHSKMSVDQVEMNSVMKRMIQATQIKVQEKTSKLIEENGICERFDELEVLTKESEELNQKLGTEAGYNYMKPKRDVALYLSDSTDKILHDADREIERLVKELEKEENDLAHRKQVLKELSTIIESQQENIISSVKN
ncbi:CRE-KBP-2 protein [Caenorhabditis remanei]|uniref:CRE-KBP-2 protein n=1 Tax=Caenorhabditis remanei TaxID=31234 RepID=E3MCM7_CAERE|nr:CRE-KBP-2 protein [Caenorhabditis remanei]